jgi:hypothetical protein
MNRHVLTGLIVALAVVIVLFIAWAVDPTDVQVPFVTLLIGIPVGLAAVTFKVVRRTLSKH